MGNQVIFSKRLMKKIFFYSTLATITFCAFNSKSLVDKSYDYHLFINLMIGFNIGLLSTVFVNYFLDKIYIPENDNKNKEILNDAFLSEDKNRNGKRDQQHQIILAVIDTLDFEPLKIPTGGKTKIKNICLKRLRVFTDSAFDHAWKDGTNLGLFRLLESDKFSSK